MREDIPKSLFGETERTEPRKAGILPAQEIHELIRNGKIRSSAEIKKEEQVQPASIDLRLGNVAYRVQASFLPNRQYPIGPKIRELLLDQVDLTKPAMLGVGEVYIVPVVESLALPRDIAGKANPKSTTGRLDIFTRLMTEGRGTFDDVPAGYSGGLYVEIVSRTFPVIVQTGTRLNQLRFLRGNPRQVDEQLRKIEQKRPLVYYYENGNGHPKAALRGEGVRLTVALKSADDGEIVAYRARRDCPPIDLSRVKAYDAEEYWVPICAGQANRLVLQPGEFYLLASKEGVSVPPEYAAEMIEYDPSIGEFTVHYAGFFDPGFGYGGAGEIRGTKAVLEVRAHEVPILLEDGQEVGRLVYHRMANRPDKVYGQGIGSSYQNQGLALSKQFAAMPQHPRLARKA